MMEAHGAGPESVDRGPGSRDIDCIELVELVTEYLEGSLPADDVARLERHLAGCDGCDMYVEQFRQLIRAAGHVEPEAVPPEAMERLLRVYREFKASSR